MVDPKRAKVSTTGSSSRTMSSFRFSRTASSSFASIERPPVVMEWNANVLRVGHSDQHNPQHLIPWKMDNEGTNSNSTRYSQQDDWYFVIAPLVHKIWNHCLMLDPSSRRVVCIKPTLICSKAWEAAMTQALWDIGVPAVYFVSCLETVPYCMGWNRGLVVHVGKHEAQTIVLADGASLHDTFQAVPCGYETVVPDDDTLPVEWTDGMKAQWLDERNPNSLMMALLKCLSACPTDLKRDVVSNLVFAGDAMVLVPDLPRRVKDRLIAVLTKSSASFEEDPAVSDSLTVIPTDYATLSPLAPAVSVTSTSPFRPDLVSWVGASLWATLWLRQAGGDENANTNWFFSPENDS